MPGRSDERLVTGRISLGSRVREARMQAGKALAELAASAGISYSYLSDVERGRRLPSLEVLDSLALALGTSVAGILRGLYPWDVAEPPDFVSPPPDGRRRVEHSDRPDT